MLIEQGVPSSMNEQQCQIPFFHARARYIVARITTTTTSDKKNQNLFLFFIRRYQIQYSIIYIIYTCTLMPFHSVVHNNSSPTLFLRRDYTVSVKGSRTICPTPLPFPQLCPFIQREMDTAIRCPVLLILLIWLVAACYIAICGSTRRNKKQFIVIYM